MESHSTSEAVPSDHMGMGLEPIPCGPAIIALLQRLIRVQVSWLAGRYGIPVERWVHWSQRRMAPCAANSSLRYGVLEYGFTLVELLIAVAALSFLCGILIPAVSVARASALKTGCLGNLHQIGVAIQAYACDNRQGFPVPYTCAGGGYVSYDDLLGDFDGREITEAAKVSPYLTLTGGTQLNHLLKLANMYRCPAETTWSDPTYGSNGSRFVRSYVPNRAYVGGGSRDSLRGSVSKNIKGIFCPPDASLTGNWGWAVRLTAIGRPSECIMLTEVRKVNAYLGGSNGDAIDNAWSGPVSHGQPSASLVEGHLQAPSSNYWTATGPLHGAAWNYLFCDGRSATMRPEATLAPGANGTAGATTVGSMWWR